MRKTSTLFQTRKLCTVYPDISGQLCNKHVKRLSKLKTLFKNIYDDMEPQGYVLVNGVAKVVDLGHDLHLSLALENGVTVLYSKTQKNEDIYINGNNIQQELIFNSEGKHVDGIHQKITEITNLVNMIRKTSSQEKEFYGGIVYIHSNISENLFSFQECMMAGLALALLLIHEELNRYTQQNLVSLVCSADKKLSTKMVKNLIEKYSLNNMVVETTFSQQKKEEQIQVQVSSKRIRPRARTEAIQRPIFSQITNNCNRKKVDSPQNGKENIIYESNQQISYNFQSPKRITEKQIYDQNSNSSQCISRIEIQSPTPTKNRAIHGQNSHECIKINVHSPTLQTDGIKSDFVPTEKSILTQSANQFAQINVLNPLLHTEKSIFSSISSQAVSIYKPNPLSTEKSIFCTNMSQISNQEQNYQNTQTQKSIVEIRTSCLAESNLNDSNLRTEKELFDTNSSDIASSNLLNPYWGKDHSMFDTSTSVKKSMNSMRTAEDELMIENGHTDNDSGSSFGSFQKIQNYPSQELKSVQVRLKDNNKLVFCKLEISKKQESDFNSKMANISKINDFIEEEGISRSDLINADGEVVLPKALKDVVGQNGNLVEYCEQMRNLLFSLANKTIQFDEFVKFKYDLDRKYNIYDGEVDQILSKLQASNKYIQNFCIIEGSVLLISMDKLYYAEMMIFLRKLLNESKLSTQKYLMTMKDTDQEDKYNDISETMFTAMPSVGYAVYKPAEQENFWI